MTTAELNTRIEALEDALATPAAYPTEVYTRIVGYYRSLANWNAGKREEYEHRVTFAEDPARVATALATDRRAASYLVFVQDSCPRCPAMKARVSTLPLPGETIDVATEAGYQAASDWAITATPTLVLRDGQGREIARILGAEEWATVEASL